MFLQLLKRLSHRCFPGSYTHFRVSSAFPHASPGAGSPCPSLRVRTGDLDTHLAGVWRREGRVLWTQPPCLSPEASPLGRLAGSHSRSSAQSDGHTADENGAGTGRELAVGLAPPSTLSSSRLPGLWLSLLLLPVAAHLVQEGVPLPGRSSAVGGGPWAWVGAVGGGPRAWVGAVGGGQGRGRPG